MLSKLTRTEVGWASHTGLVRALNEDALLALDLRLGASTLGISFGLYAVADGIGGHEAGEIASGLALRVLAGTIVRSVLSPRLRGQTDRLCQESHSQTLRKAVKAADKQVYVHAQAKGNDMGTTLAAALVVGTTVHIANVGDSRVYLSQGDGLRQMTTDHSLVAVLVAAGEITPDEIYTHPRRNIITRCLGPQESVEVDLFTEQLQPGHSLLLCSDGLWEMVKDDQIRDAVLGAQDPQAACEELVELANQNGGIDNISLIIVKVTE